MYDRVTGFKDSSGKFHDNEEAARKAELALLSEQLARMGNPDEIGSYLVDNSLTILPLLAASWPFPAEVFIGEKSPDQGRVPPSNPRRPYHPPVTTSDEVPDLAAKLMREQGLIFSVRCSEDGHVVKWLSEETARHYEDNGLGDIIEPADWVESRRQAEEAQATNDDASEAAQAAQAESNR